MESDWWVGNSTALNILCTTEVLNVEIKKMIAIFLNEQISYSTVIQVSFFSFNIVSWTVTAANQMQLLFSRLDKKIKIKKKPHKIIYFFILKKINK